MEVGESVALWVMRILNVMNESANTRAQSEHYLNTALIYYRMVQDSIQPMARQDGRFWQDRRYHQVSG